MYDLSGNYSGDYSFANNDSLTNASLSCLARTLQNAPVLWFSPALITSVRSLRVVVYFIIAICGVILNSLFLYLVYKYKKLQTPSFAIALQVSVMDLLSSLVLLPSFVISSITERLLQVEALCGFFGFLLHSIIPLRVCLMFFLVVDRFLLVFTPFWYPKKEVKLVLLFSLLSWGGSLLTSVPFLLGIMDCIGYLSVSGNCRVTSVCGRHCRMVSRTLSSVLAVLSTLPVLLYAALYCKAKKATKEESVASGGTSTNETQWKATITFFLLFLTLSLVIWPTLIIMQVSNSLPLSPASYIINTLWRFVFMSLVITDLIVLMRNSDAKEAMKHLKEKIWKRLTTSPSG